MSERFTLLKRADLEYLEELVSIDLDEKERAICEERINRSIIKTSRMKLIDTNGVEPASGSLEAFDGAIDETVDMFSNK
jgi:Asp-tRNA(Asn)/Glu-tRNA(Gln) amidotransferase C subunit